MKLQSHLAVFAGAAALVNSLPHDSLSLGKAMYAHHRHAVALVSKSPKGACKSLHPYISHDEYQTNLELCKELGLFCTLHPSPSPRHRHVAVGILVLHSLAQLEER